MISDLALKLAEEVRAHVKQWCEGNPEVYSDLGGACGIASYALWKVYQAFQIPCDLAGNEQHCFVILKPEKVVVDLTATQFFKAPPVYVVAWDKRQSYHEPEALNQEVVEELKGWPREQRPFLLEDSIQELIEKLSAKKAAGLLVNP